jgi:lysyl-tRNA synthetase class 2
MAQGMEDRRKINLVRRAKIIQEIRRFFTREGFVEIETPCVVPSPGMEPHLSALEVFCTGPDGSRRKRYLHTSPEYAMKKLLARGWEKIFQICRVFRDGEFGRTHQMEFTMLEWYRAQADYGQIMEDCERLLAHLAEEVWHSPEGSYQGQRIDLSIPAERMRVCRAMEDYGKVDILRNRESRSLLAEARSKGYHFGPSGDYSYEEVFFKVFLEAVEPRLGVPKPTLLYDYPAPMAALARLQPGNSLWAERFELYVAGMELANAFSELIDPVEQRKRFEEEQGARRARGAPVYPIDEELLQALGKMPPAAGIALGVDRLVMLFCDAGTIQEVLAFGD